MERFFADYSTCCSLEEKVRTICSSNLPKIFRISHTAGFNFRVIFPHNTIIRSVSVSIPTDANRDIHRKIRGDVTLTSDNGIVYETALFNNEDEIIYDDDFYGVMGINRFDTIQKVIQEIVRIYEIVCPST
jgi:hypothetical protein